MHVREGSKWKPRLLAAAALFWAISDRTTPTDRFEHAREVIKRIFCRQPEVGQTYRGFMKMLNKWHERLLLAVVCELRLRMQQELQAQYQVAGFTVFAGDGSRTETPRTKSNQQAYSAQRKPKRNTKKKSKRGKSQSARKRKTQAAQRRKMKRQSAAAIEKKTRYCQMLTARQKVWLRLVLADAFVRLVAECDRRISVAASKYPSKNYSVFLGRGRMV